MDNWRKSSYSGPDDGNDCVEVAVGIFQTGVRDSKAPTRATLTFGNAAFAPFLTALRTSSPTAAPR
ncbi:DUF397 domain-containing protein [Streptomyces sp. CRN 30]|uniref:DUF397 domain-containing protein n=1 Tax=Streptomyces sp. CRN 30 TaxID=3075613 RepID=UPI002A80BCEE|nr:DUF397 domain-containing protein [Streptomyces sp. CRN 30]